ncbi:MAG TPA: helix-turn-helix domain-containing protein [Spirochaetota bacterium]|nr:helix-turn-helix domain-containing protein [Spirochaetota bacterium]HPI24116.1 helix-turn-helix domain-containing protein [Spirochaetota bacterium]HPU89849.1 helix-turn-helix domain-containing protein [Spirochaetota bacterium]
MDRDKAEQRPDGDAPAEDLKKFDENPYQPDRVKPEDVVRIFYERDTPLVPVVSNRNMLLGVLLKEDVVAELSDIERVKHQKIDEFVSKLSRKMTFDELLPAVANNRSFATINLFGEVTGEWTRLDLLAASEKGGGSATAIRREAEKQREEQALEWMIYLILEHLPRALYAVNDRGKTIFFNSHFEDLVVANTGAEIDVDAVEKAFADTDANEFFYRPEGDEIFFYNKELDIHYEKVPMTSGERTVGFLIYCSRSKTDHARPATPHVETAGMSLNQMLDAFVRKVLVDAVKTHGYNLETIAKELGISRPALLKKIQKYRISMQGGHS